MELDDSIPLSTLKHYSYCPRPCCLNHGEKAFAEHIYRVRIEILSNYRI